jgi:hypothetical protein
LFAPDSAGIQVFLFLLAKNLKVSVFSSLDPNGLERIEVSVLGRIVFQIRIFVHVEVFLRDTTNRDGSELVPAIPLQQPHVREVPNQVELQQQQVAGSN